MAEYLLELYVPAGEADTSDTGAADVRAAAATMAADGKVVRYVRSIYVAADETCFVLLEAETSGIVQEVARLAGVPSNRVSEVASEPTGGGPR
jgi:hypothetical protein